MKQYQEIEYYGDHWGLPIIAFDKLDGSNLRFEYSHKRGFYKFGTRNMMIDGSHETFGFAVDLFLNKYSESLSRIFRSKGYRDEQSFVCFAELFGKNSAFGRHNSEDVFDIVLFDVEAKKSGLVHPRQFIKDFYEAGIPRVVYDGNLNRELVRSVKDNEFGLVEGVICKGTIPNRRGLYYCKIKTNEWFDRLRSNHPELYEEEVRQARNSEQINLQ